MCDQEELDGAGDAGGGRFHLLQPNRDLRSNWEVDLAKNLEDYLLKICSSEISDDQDHPLHSVNFAEAALLLQGSVQVYSRKVEYLHSLVLHALEFLSQRRLERQDQQEVDLVQPDGRTSNKIVDEEEEMFWGLDDVAVDPKNSLDGGLDEDNSSKPILKPPANLIVHEGDCLDNCGDAGELESYLLATCGCYGDFLLLDPCDAGAVCDLQTNAGGKENVPSHRGSSARSKSRHRTFASPAGRSGGIARGSSIGKNPDQTLDNNFDFEETTDNNSSKHHVDPVLLDNDACFPDEANVGNATVTDDSDDENEDPWKPLNPHEPGNLRIKPFRKVKAFARQVICAAKRNMLASQFPMARLDGVISPEFAKSFEELLSLQEKLHGSQSPPFYEKLRRSLTIQDTEHNVFGCFQDENGANACEVSPNHSEAEDDQAHDIDVMDTDILSLHDKNGGVGFDGGVFEGDNIDSHESLEDLCRSHLDVLLASIAETEKQTELDARVSTWKERIEHALEEQDTHAPFDISFYGEQIMDKLCSQADNEGPMSFTHVVKGQHKHEVARSFSALLQLVNSGKVELERTRASNELVCHTATNPFYVRLLGHDKREEQEPESRFARKRNESRLQKGCRKGSSYVTTQATSPSKSTHQSSKLSVKSGKGNGIRRTPEGKRRRKSARLMEPFNLQPRDG